MAPSLYATEATFFTRNRKLTFPAVVCSLLNLFKESVEYNLSVLSPLFNQQPVTGAAFSLARYKIDISFFKDLNKILVDLNNKEAVVRWKGFQLIAGDGSTVALPASRQIKDYFGIYSKTAQGVHTCLAQVFLLYDVLTNVVIEGRLSKMETGEKTLLRECLDDLPIKKAIFILDRGFGYFGECKQFFTQKRDFCIRISGSISTFGRMVKDNPSDDFQVLWEPSDMEKATCRCHGQNTDPILVRVSKIKLASGEIEILVSSLFDTNMFSLDDLKELYRLRWGIEEGFKKLKPKMKLEHFGSRKPAGIFQEFQTHLFMMNIIATIGNIAQREVDKKCSKRKLAYKYNWQNAFRFIRNKFIELIYCIDLENLIEHLVQCISTSVTAVKPDRSFPRLRIKKRKPRLHQTYK